MRLTLLLPRFVTLLFGWALLGLATVSTAAAAGPGAGATPSLAEALNPDGTLRAGAAGSFDARQFTMQTAPDGRPVFRPSGAMGAGDFRWADGFGLPDGANGRVNAVVRLGADMYVGGSFSAVGNVAANGVAKWNGTAWSNLGTGSTNGVDGIVYALAVSGSGDVYAGGFFGQTGGGVARNIAKWNGTAWSSLGTGAANGVIGTVAALAVSGSGEVYAGGSFNQAGSVLTDYVAKWNGTAWSALGNGVDAEVTALAVSGNGELYVGGSFNYAGNVAANRIAKWDGTTWSSLGAGSDNGVSNPVLALAVSGSGDVYVGGSFVEAGGMPARNIAKWDGTAWSSLSMGTATGVSSAVTALAVSGSGEVYAGGRFTFAGSVAANALAKWNGTAWSSLSAGAGNGVFGSVSALALSGSGEVYAGGGFALAGGVAANNIAKWNATTWNSLGTGLGNGLNGPVFALAVSGSGDMYVGGQFSRAGGVAANNIAKWNGTAWSSLGTGAANGVNDGVFALAVSGSGDVYAAGLFSQAGGASANRIAKWNGAAWSSLGSRISNGFNGTVYALALAGNGELYAGGYFTGAFTGTGSVTAHNIARWNGTAWSSLGTGVNNAVSFYEGVYALAVSGSGEVYAGGSFTHAGGVAAKGIAKWNGAAWSSLGTGGGNGVDGVVYALAIAGNGDVYVGGRFAQAGGTAANSIAKWNGTAWSSLGTGAANGVGSEPVYALALSGNGELYAGGGFFSAGGVAATSIAKWNGTTWNTLGTGLNRSTRALAVGLVNKLYAGGYFTAMGDYSKVSAGLAIYDPAAVSAAAPSAPRAALTLAPNPAHGAATLTLLPAATARAGQVLDGLGRVLRAFVVPGGAGTAALPVGGLPAGAYVVRVGAASARLVVE